MSLAVVLLPLAGLAMLAYVGWCRAGRTSAARWWEGSWWHERAILLVVPGLALVLLAAGPLTLYDDGPEPLLWLTIPVVVGLLMAAWGGLGLPIPAVLRPTWQRTQDRPRTEDAP